MLIGYEPRHSRRNKKIKPYHSLKNYTNNNVKNGIIKSLSIFLKLAGLNNSNWEHWKTRTRALFTLAGLIKWFDGTITQPTPIDENKPKKEEMEAIEKHQEKEKETKALLQLAIGPPLELAHTYSANNAAEMWKQLSDVKEPKGIHGVINAYRAIFCTYANEGDSIMDHISKL